MFLLFNSLIILDLIELK